MLSIQKTTPKRALWITLGLAVTGGPTGVGGTARVQPAGPAVAPSFGGCKPPTKSSSAKKRAKCSPEKLYKKLLRKYKKHLANQRALVSGPKDPKDCVFWCGEYVTPTRSAELRERSADPSLSGDERDRLRGLADKLRALEDRKKAAQQMARPESASTAKATPIDAQPIRVRYAKTPDDDAWIYFAHAQDAADVLSVSITPIWYAVNTKGVIPRGKLKDYEVERAYNETQADLTSKKNGKEEWKNIVDEADKVLVRISNYGRAQVPTPRGDDKWSDKYTPGKGEDAYATLRVGGKIKRMHDLVLTLFGPERPTAEHTADHQADHQGNRNKGDNRLCNLEWATKSRQVINRGDRRPQSTGQAVEARRADDPNAPWIRYPSLGAAAKALSVDQGAISAVLSGRIKSTGGYVFRRPEGSADGGEDLKGGINGDEKWANVTDRLRVSTYGRVWTKTARGDGWGQKRGVKSCRGMHYCVVKCNGRNEYVHILVMRAFGGAPEEEDQTTVHHINNDPEDNRLCNLMWASRSEQCRWKDRNKFDADMAARTANACKGKHTIKRAPRNFLLTLDTADVNFDFALLNRHRMLTPEVSFLYRVGINFYHKGKLVDKRYEDFLTDAEKMPDFGRFNDQTPDAFDRIKIVFLRQQQTTLS